MRKFDKYEKIIYKISNMVLFLIKYKKIKLKENWDNEFKIFKIN
jgi:hypothetical protein